MTSIRPLATIILALLTSTPLVAKDPVEVVHLPLRVHLITGIEMIREVSTPDAATKRTTMGMPLSTKDAVSVMKQVNDIWAPAGIQWVTDPEQGGGGIISEQAGGGQLSEDRLKSLADLVVARARGSKMPYMDTVFPALADPQNNENIDNRGIRKPNHPAMYHLYLFPYIGQTLQGTATISGTFAIVGVHSDKRPNKKGYPKLRPLLIPTNSKSALTIANFPKDGALSATIAHELGHNLSLLHVDEGMKDNLMKGHVKLRLGPKQIAKARAQAMKGPRIIRPATGPASIQMESLPGEGVWTSPLPRRFKGGESPLRVTVWFDKQFLGDGRGYSRRAKEFAGEGRRELRESTTKALKKQSLQSFAAAREQLEAMQERKQIRDLDRHWIVNGFSCTTSEKHLSELKKVPGIRKIFLRSPSVLPRPKLPDVALLAETPPPEQVTYEKLPWYVARLKADRVWRDFGITGEGTLNVIHDNNFILSDHLVRTIYRNPDEVPGNGIDDDRNGYIDDHHGYNFDRQSAALYTRPFTGRPEDRKILHGTNCATIVCGSGDQDGTPQFGVAPMARWAGVINRGGIERSVEWAIEQGADTYSMSFSRRHYGEYQSHWRKVMEHGSFCGVFFVSGAGNVERGDEHPFLMNIPQNIPNAVFAAAGVQRDLSKTPFSCVGPVEWQTEHYQDGVVQKPEVCAFNIDVPCLFPDGSVHPNLLRGNSYAGPMFCGAIALMLSADPDLLPWDLQEIITSTATEVGPKGIDYETGHGLINCHAAVKEVLRRKE